jgi:transketolase
MRPTIRLAAMMQIPVVYVFTHDSIGLGEDGPTHQPIEHLTALRAIPNLVVIRPADGNETASAWKVALERKNGPTALILTRQNLPILTAPNNDLTCGAYVLKDSPDGKPEIILIGTGSEVSIAYAASELLEAQGKKVRVVSMPSWELFDQQTDEYKSRVLLPGIPYVGIEAGVTLAWNRYVPKDQGYTIGLDRFGASAPYKTLYQELGLTAEKVQERANSLLLK